MAPGHVVAAQRQEWAAEIYRGIAQVAGDYPALGPVVADPCLDDPYIDAASLERALVVAHIARLLAKGQTVGAVSELLLTNAILASAGPDDLLALVRRVHYGLGSDGIVGAPWLKDSGLAGWDPDATYLFLLELWSAWRLASVSRARVKRDLRQYWGLCDPQWFDECLSRPAEPLLGYSDIWTRARADPDFRVGNLVALSLSRGPGSDEAWEHWVDQAPFSIVRAQHLYDLGGDLVRCRYAQPFLHRILAESDLDFRPVALRAKGIVEEQIVALQTAIGGLSQLERDLLQERSPDCRLQDRCVVTLLEWSSDVGRGWNSGWLGDVDALHGMWGPVPWWVVTARSEDTAAALSATLNESCLPLGFDRDPSEPDLLELVCRRPRTAAGPGMRADFVFNLTNPLHLGELLLIGRRGYVCVDAVDDTHFDLDDGRPPVWTGTFRVVAEAELAQMLVGIASERLRTLVPGKLDATVGESGQFFDNALSSPAVRYMTDGTLGHDILVTEGAVNGRIVVESSEPITAILPRSSNSRQSRVGTNTRPNGEPHGTGFVYVQQNPAIPGMVKLGFTKGLAEDRAEELSRTAVPFPFEVRYRAASMRPRNVEQTAFRILAAHRVAAGREFFRVREETAVAVLEYSRELVTGINSWEQFAVVHRLRAGDHLTLPLKRDQMFVLTAYENILDSTAKPIDLWQAHSDGDILELFLEDGPRYVHGLSTNDSDGTGDPVPFLDREDSVRNGGLIGRERLVSGDRLTWLAADQDDNLTGHVVFEIEGTCQVTCRTWNMQPGIGDMPLLLNFPTRELTRAMKSAVRLTLDIGPPDTWAPRHPDPADSWSLPATEVAPPHHWLPQLKPRRPSGGRGRTDGHG
jgi:hypothetical protein